VRRLRLTCVELDLRRPQAQLAPLFLSTEAIIVICVDLSRRAASLAHISTLMGHVKSLARSAPVLLVCTRADKFESEAEAADAATALLREALRFGDVNGALVVNLSKSGQRKRDARVLRTRICQLATTLPSAQVPITRQEHRLLEAVDKTRAALGAAGTPPLLDWSDWTNIVLASAGIGNLDEALEVTLRLPARGVCHYWRTALAGVVSRTLILDISWTLAMGLALSSVDLPPESVGHLPLLRIGRFWRPPRFPEETHDFIIGLLAYFEIAALIVEQGCLLLPSAIGSGAGTGMGAAGGGDEHFRPDSPWAWTRTGPADGSSTSSSTASGHASSSPIPKARRAASQSAFKPLALLASRPPGATSLSSTADEGGDGSRHHVYRRAYRLDFLPDGLFGRLVVRLVSSRALTLRQLASHSCTVADVAGANTVSFVELPRLRTITVAVAGSDPEGLLRGTTMALNSVLALWYQIPYQVDIPCTSCVAAGETRPFSFAAELCSEMAAAGHVSITCGLEKLDVSLKRLIPEAVFTDTRVRRVTLDEDIFLDPADSASPSPRPLTPDQGKVDPTVLLSVASSTGTADGPPRGATIMARSQSGCQLWRAVYQEDRVVVKQLVLGEASGLFSIEDRRAALREFRQEAWTMSTLEHPNVLALSAFCLKPPCLIMPFMGGGDLYSFLHDRQSPLPVDQPLPALLRVRIAYECASALSYLHALDPPLLHGDMKTPNVLLAGDSGLSHFVAAASGTPGVDGSRYPSSLLRAPVAKLGDFGSSVRMYMGKLRTRANLRIAANPTWLAPEVISEQWYDTKADVYSLAIVMGELSTRQHPFCELSSRFQTDLEDAVVSGVRPQLNPSLAWGGDAYRALVAEAWNPDPSARPKANRIMEALAGPVADEELGLPSCEKFVRWLRKDTARQRERSSSTANVRSASTQSLTGSPARHVSFVSGDDGERSERALRRQRSSGHGIANSSSSGGGAYNGRFNSMPVSMRDLEDARAEYRRRHESSSPPAAGTSSAAAGGAAPPPLPSTLPPGMRREPSDRSVPRLDTTRALSVDRERDRGGSSRPRTARDGSTHGSLTPGTPKRPMTARSSSASSRPVGGPLYERRLSSESPRSPGAWPHSARSNRMTMEDVMTSIQHSPDVSDEEGDAMTPGKVPRSLSGPPTTGGAGGRRRRHSSGSAASALSSSQENIPDIEEEVEAASRGMSKSSSRKSRSGTSGRKSRDSKRSGKKATT
jgi:hypothetical protein